MLRDGEFELVDSSRNVRTGRQKLEPVTVVKSGKVYRQSR